MNNIEKNILIKNKKILYDYEIIDTYNAGIVLQGWEVKSIKFKSCQLINSYIYIKNNEAWILNLIINPLKFSTLFKQSMIKDRSRKILLNKSEIKKLFSKVKEKKYSIIPIYIYNNKGYIKIHIGLCRGKTLYNKKLSSQNKSWQLEKQRVFKKFIMKNNQ